MNHKLRIAVTGASGLFGTAIIDQLAEEYDVFATSRTLGYCGAHIKWQLFDILDSKKLNAWLNEIKPEIVIHCAALVNVDLCETNATLAQKLHADVTLHISRIISEWDGRLIYISTDSVFDGSMDGCYSEEDIPNPLNQYASTKRQGELNTLESGNGLVLRTNIFGWSRIDSISFAEWVLMGLVNRSVLNMFLDVHYTPIHVSHAAKIISLAIKKNLTGLFHLTGSSVISKYEFALEMAKIFQLSANFITPVSMEQSGLSAKRPKNMALSNQKLVHSIKHAIPLVEEGISLLKTQYDHGWLAKIKNRTMKTGYHFWENV